MAVKKEIIKNDCPKTKLFNFLQKKIGRSCNKEDTKFVCTKSGSNFTAKLTLTCLDGQTFNGSPAPNQKDAERSAAQKALNKFGKEVQELCPPNNGPSKRAQKLAERPDPEKKPKTECKAKLRRFLTKVLGRECTDSDMKFNTVETGDMNTSTVTLPKLKAGTKNKYEGEPRKSPIAAEALAADAALEALKLAYPEHTQQQEKQPKTPWPEDAIKAKTELNLWLVKVMGSDVPKSARELNVTEIGGSYSASLQYSCLPGDFSAMTWDGSGSTKAEAEQDVFKNAHEFFSSSSEFQELLANAKPSKKKSGKSRGKKSGGGGRKSKGKGKGRGGGGGGNNATMQMLENMIRFMGGGNMNFGGGGKKGNSASTKKAAQSGKAKLQGGLNAAQKEKSVKLSNLPSEATDEHLRQLGEQISTVSKASIMFKGIGRIEFANKADAAFALPLLDGAQVGENIIKASTFN